MSFKWRIVIFRLSPGTHMQAAGRPLSSIIGQRNVGAG